MKNKEVKMKRKKRILIASDTLLPRWDGVSSFLNQVIPRLSKDYKITVLAPKFDGDFKGYKGVRIIRFPLIKIVKLADTFACRPGFRRILKEVGKCDLVWAQDIAPVAILSIIAARIKKKPVIAYIHSLEWELYTKAISAKGFKAWLVSNTMKFIDRAMYNRCTLLLIPSIEIGEILNWQGIRTEKHIVHMGVDTKRFKPPLNKMAAKKAIGLNPKDFVIGYAGRVGAEKDIITLLRAFLRIRKKHSNTVLLIAGGGTELMDKTIRSKKNVYAFGRTDHIEKYLQAMDVYVLPSLTETSSLSTMEAMSCGLAVIATPVGYVKGYIIEGKNGMFFPKKDSVVLSKKLEMLIKDSALRKTLGFNARRTIQQGFSWEKTVEELRKVFDVFS
jgi:glycosyltransferase involved in cell wall biosynthesis